MPGPRRAQGARSQLGVTLIEMAIAIAIIGVALGGTLGVMSRTVSGSADPMLTQQALAIGDAYLEEILAKPFYDPDLGAGGGVCPAAEAGRALWDNVCDYLGLDDAGARDQTDTPVAGLGSYRVQVFIDTAANLGLLTGATVVARVDVVVTSPNLPAITLSGYRTSF